jgi:CBS domain-containing protein
MKAEDVMVSTVITAGVNASIGEVAAILLHNHISAAPVVDEKGELVGIVSEGDLMRRPEIGTTKRHSWWLELISNKSASATEYIKSHSRKVADVMTRDLITAKPDNPAGRYRRIAGAQSNQARSHCRRGQTRRYREPRKYSAGVGECYQKTSLPYDCG